MIFESEKKFHVTLSDVFVNLNKFEYLSAIPGIVSTRGHNSCARVMSNLKKKKGILIFKS